MRTKFYHLAWLLLTSFALAAAEPPAAGTPPPRSIDDIERLLDHYKPDPAAVDKIRAEADAAPPATEERVALFRFYWFRGLAADKLGRTSQYIADLRRAAEYGEPGSADHVRMLRNLASAETSGGNLLNAVKVAEEGWKQTPANQLGQALAAEQLLAHQYVALGDFESARKHLSEAEYSYGRLQRSPNWDRWRYNWTALVERARAELFRAEGRHVEAEGAYRRALRNTEMHLEHVAQGPQDEVGRLVADAFRQYREAMERSLVGVLLAQGKLAEAEVFARRTLQHALERVGRASTSAGMGLSLLSHTMVEQGRDREAIRLAEEALKSYQLAGVAPESLSFANARRALASAFVAQGRYAEADRAFREMREGLRKDPQLLQKVGAGDLDWILAMLRTGQQAEAERMAKAMLDHSIEHYGDKAARTTLRRAYYAMALAARGERTQALALFARAVPELLDQARAEAEGENGSVKRSRQLVSVLEAYLRLLAEVGSQPGLDAAAEAFRVADIARGSAVQRALTSSAARANLGDPKLAELARREQDAQRRIKALSELLTQLLAAPPEQQLPKIQADMQRDIARLREERAALKREIAERFPDYAELVDPKPASLAEAKKSLRPGEALVAFYFAEEQGYVWALTAAGGVSFAVVPMTRAALAQEVVALRRALDPGVAELEQIPAFDVAAGHRLYSRLLAPVEPAWKDARVLLAVPHGPLGQLPLALLPTQAVPQPGATAVPFAGYQGVPWLLRRVAVAQLPSVTALASLRKMPAGDSSRRPFIGFGDPLFSPAQAREAGVRLAAAPTLRGRTVALRAAARTALVDSASLALLPRLPDTNEEIREVGRVLGAVDEDIYLQLRATVKTVLETDLSKRRVVMFATHGLVPGDLDGLTQPALALTSPDVAGGNGSGLLTMDEVLTLKLDADWVVMSACNTAAGEGSGSEAVSGLGRAFFYAGARALLASNWPVETEAARLIMTELFRRQAKDPRLAKAEALRQSMAALLDGPGSVDPKTGRADYSHAHPLFWAPFVVVGD